MDGVGADFLWGYDGAPEGAEVMSFRSGRVRGECNKRMKIYIFFFTNHGDRLLSAVATLVYLKSRGRRGVGG